MKTYELITRILCDSKPETKTDATFLFSQTADNQKSVFLTAQSLLENNLTQSILIIDTTPKSGYPGFILCQEGLKEQGISEDQIQGVPVAGTPILHTLIESEALIRFVQSKGYKQLTVVSSPFHQLRAFITTVTVALREYAELKIYSQAGYALSWMEKVFHSQGTLSGSRSQLIWDGMKRIETYQKKGDLASFDTVLEYLSNRDNA